MNREQLYHLRGLIEKGDKEGALFFLDALDALGFSSKISGEVKYKYSGVEHSKKIVLNKDNYSNLNYAYDSVFNLNISPWDNRSVDNASMLNELRNLFKQIAKIQVQAYFNEKGYDEIEYLDNQKSIGILCKYALNKLFPSELTNFCDHLTIPQIEQAFKANSSFDYYTVINKVPIFITREAYTRGHTFRIFNDFLGLNITHAKDFTEERFFKHLYEWMITHGIDKLKDCNYIDYYENDRAIPRIDDTNFKLKLIIQLYEAVESWKSKPRT